MYQYTNFTFKQQKREIIVFGLAIFIIMTLMEFEVISKMINIQAYRECKADMKAEKCKADFEDISVRTVIRLILNLYGGTGIMFAFVLFVLASKEKSLSNKGLYNWLHKGSFLGVLLCLSKLCLPSLHHILLIFVLHAV